MNYEPHTLVDVVATRHEGGAITYLNPIMADIDAGRSRKFDKWKIL